MTLAQRCRFILAAAQVLFVNGQATDQTVLAAQRLGDALGLRVVVLARWGALTIQAQGATGTCVVAAAAEPTGVDMGRVAALMRLIGDVGVGGLSHLDAMNAVAAIGRAPPASTWLFALAAGAGAVALAVLFGVQHPAAAALIFLSGGAGGLLRRGLARISGKVFVQSFCAALLAGLVGALAVRCGLSSSLRLVAVCPCMVLVPGPHLLNGALDLMRARIGLGAARLRHAGLVALAISIGVLLGLAVLGVSLPMAPPGRSVPLWQDLFASALAIAAYGVFFAMPLRMLPSPVAVGTLSHGLRWIAVTVLGADAATGAFVACLAVGLSLTPVARRFRLPFAAIGFASVVSMIPGVLLFRTASGLVQMVYNGRIAPELMRATALDAAGALTIILAMSLGLIVPNLARDALGRLSGRG